jgi:NAD(P)-dependent dehydrogenase (short-subunit alcohol dehydrogenase family)
MLLADKVAVISGVGPGLGRAVALTLAREGADVVVSARTPDTAAVVAAEVEELGRRAVRVTADATDPSDCDRVAHAAVTLGGPHVLVNNAFAEEDWRLPFGGLDPQRWREPVAVNVFGSLALTRAVVPGMKALGGGSIVMINTLSIRHVNPVLGGYAASKRGLETAARVLAKELGPSRIRVNSVAPGHIWGETLREYFDWIARRRGVARAEVADEIADMTALRHIPTPEEVARTVLFFASDLSRVVTGQTLDVNCGRTTH